MALDEEKFDRWQPNLLALLNEPKLKRFARWRMGLSNRAALDEEIIAIDPHHITVPLGVNQFRSSFSSQPAIQKGLYHGFKPVFKQTSGGHTWINWRNYLQEFAPMLFQ